MVSNPSRLNSRHDILVIDASVAINLLGTGRPADLLRELNRRVIIDEVALREVTSDPFSKLPGHEAIGALMRSSLISPGTTQRFGLRSVPGTHRRSPSRRSWQR